MVVGERDVAGTVIGTALTAPLALVSLRTATNLSTSSGAQFGVRGRLVGSVLGLLLALGYTALTVWIGGDVMVSVLGRLFGLPTNGLSYAVVYAVLAAATVAGAGADAVWAARPGAGKTHPAKPPPPTPHSLPRWGPCDRRITPGQPSPKRRVTAP